MDKQIDRQMDRESEPHLDIHFKLCHNITFTSLKICLPKRLTWAEWMEKWTNRLTKGEPEPNKMLFYENTQTYKQYWKLSAPHTWYAWAKKGNCISLTKQK